MSDEPTVRRMGDDNSGGVPFRLGALSATARHFNEAERELRTAVLKAREHDISWVLIGRILGLSPDAAQDRFEVDPEA